MSLLVQTNLSAEDPNKFYGGCCTEVVMDVINTDKDPLDITEFSVTSNPNNWVSNITIDGNPVSTPFSLSTGSHELKFTFCPNSVDTLTVLFKDSAFNTYSFSFPISEIVLQTELDLYNAPLNFGNVAVGNSQTINFFIPDTVYQCVQYDFTNLVAPFSIQPTETVCFGDGFAIVPITFSPTALGYQTQNLIVNGLDECQSAQFFVDGTGIEAPSGGGTPNGQKNKVDQTTRVEACSPRTANNRCQTARTMQSAIRTNARRFGKR